MRSDLRCSVEEEAKEQNSRILLPRGFKASLQALLVLMRRPIISSSNQLLFQCYTNHSLLASPWRALIYTSWYLLEVLHTLVVNEVSNDAIHLLVFPCSLTRWYDGSILCVRDRSLYGMNSLWLSLPNVFSPGKTMSLRNQITNIAL